MGRRSSVKDASPCLITPLVRASGADSDTIEAKHVRLAIYAFRVPLAFGAISFDTFEIPVGSC